MKTFHFRQETHKTQIAAWFYINIISNVPRSWIVKSLAFFLDSISILDCTLSFFYKSTNVCISVSKLATRMAEIPGTSSETITETVQTGTPPPPQQVSQRVKFLFRLFVFSSSGCCHEDCTVSTRSSCLLHLSTACRRQPTSTCLQLSLGLICGAATSPLTCNCLVRCWLNSVGSRLNRSSSGMRRSVRQWS